MFNLLLQLLSGIKQTLPYATCIDFTMVPVSLYRLRIQGETCVLMCIASLLVVGDSIGSPSA